MRLKIWGCRGSLAAPGPETVRYGGNTSCVEVRLDDGTLIILDAGTGIRLLGRELAASPPSRIYLFLTHLHMDHLEGIGFFAPLFAPQTEIHIWGPPSPTTALSSRIARYMSPPLFPVHLQEVPSKVTFHDAPWDTWELGAARIHSQPISHQGPTVGYRIDENSRSLAYLPDHEPALGIDLRSVGTEWISGFSLAEGADLLLHDSQYTEQEYAERVGWGHSSVEHVVTFGLVAGARQLVMFHHDPMHSDAELDSKGEIAAELWAAGGGPGRPILASEGMVLDLAGVRSASG